MSKDTFWALIQEAKTACGQDMDAITEHLRDGLLIMGTGAARQFHNIFQAYMDLAEPFGLWGCGQYHQGKRLHAGGIH